MLGKLGALFQIGNAPGNDQRRRRIKHGDVSIGSWRSLKHLPQGASIENRIVTFQIPGVGSLKTGILGRNLEDANSTTSKRGNFRWAGRRNLIAAIRTMHHPSRTGPKGRKHARDWLDPGSRKDTHQDPINPGRVGKRSKQIENRSGAELCAHGPDMPE
jgi:hypothetical protein